MIEFVLFTNSFCMRKVLPYIDIKGPISYEFVRSAN